MSKTSVVVVVVLLVSAMVFSCQRRVGECEYGEAGSETQTATIRDIRAEETTDGPMFVVQIEQYGQQDFWLSEEEYQTCIVDGGLDVNSEVEIWVQHGGPCPPIVDLTQCD